MEPNDQAPQTKKRRGPYKLYLQCGSGESKIPRQTLLSRKKALARAQQELDQAHNAIIQGHGDETVSNNDHNLGEAPDRDLDDLTSEHESSSSSESRDDESIERSQGSSEESTSEPEVSGDESQALNLGEERPKQTNYIQKYYLNDLLHPNFSHSKLDVLLIILHLAIRHCHTQHFVEDMVKFVNFLFGFNVLDVSYHIFKNIFPASSSVKRYYFCDVCDICVGSEDEFPLFLTLTRCPKCQKEIKINSVDSENYFVTLSVKEQVEDLLARPEIKLVTRDPSNLDTISDIFDGEMYKKCFDSGSPLSNKDALTCILNTDGVRVFENSVQGSLWPVFLHLNEIQPEVRFKTENLILAGLWFGKASPNMAMYLKPILKNLLDLSRTGVAVKQPDGSILQRPLFVMGMSVDSVAKAKLLCQHQFNGAYSCLYCYHPNDAVSNESNINQKHFDSSVTYPTRTEQEVTEDMMHADTLERAGQLKKSHVRGFLGLSILLMFRSLVDIFNCNPFSIIWSNVIDYLHALLEGIASDLLSLYLTILMPHQTDTVNKRLKQIALPQGMSRKPRPIGGKVKYKAKEYRSFFLYFAVPCFEDLLPRREFLNLKHFVSALYVLLGDSISKADLNRARRDLQEFVTGFQSIYGLHRVTYNLHLCTHLVDQVTQTGPLWAYSNFIFESGNGQLVKLIRGTRSVLNEICVKYTQLKSALLCVNQHPVSEAAQQFCSEILGNRFKKIDMSDGISVTGSYSFCAVDSNEMFLFNQHNVPVVNGKVKVFNRVVKNGSVYVSQCYTKARTNDSCAQLDDGSFVTLDKFVLSADGILKCLIKPIRIADGNHLVDSIKKCSYYVHGEASIITASAISRKCVFIHFDDKKFVCCIPNHYERD